MSQWCSESEWIFRMAIISRLACLLVVIGLSNVGAHAGHPFHDFVSEPDAELSPMMVNLNGLAYYSVEQPFLDLVKLAGGRGGSGKQTAWLTQVTKGPFDTGEQQYLNLDSNGWPINLGCSKSGGCSFNAVGMLLNQISATDGGYRAGRYIVSYQGTGTISYGFDASLVSSSPGRDVINVATPKDGIIFQISSTDSRRTGDYIRNLHIVRADYEAQFKAGQIFNPDFLARVSPFRGYRFMDWLATNGSTQTTWLNRLMSRMYLGLLQGYQSKSQ